MPTYTINSVNQSVNTARSQDSPGGSFALARLGTGSPGLGTESGGGYSGNLGYATKGGTDYEINEAFYDFDTSSIPGTETVTSVTLTLTLHGSTSVGSPSPPNDSHEVYSATYTLGSLAGSDFVPGASLTTPLGQVDFVRGTSGTYSFTSAAAFLTAINKGGHTQLLVVPYGVRINQSNTAIAQFGNVGTDSTLVVVTTAGAAGITISPNIGWGMALK